FGQTRIVVRDPKVIAHFYARETWTYYLQRPFSLMIVESMVDRGLVWAQSESHRRQRKAIAPAFSDAAIENFTSAFTTRHTMSAFAI
ncbi:hypothetical protein DEU56DRAFT_736650, partial [Suillus clintonianus]|uniref:uncharacterized protein n=1 Tax=Suillus clintonianus TaxID=1904413 RepID=UPI001B86C6D8